jgi:hypothetical protein
MPPERPARDDPSSPTAWPRLPEAPFVLTLGCEGCGEAAALRHEPAGGLVQWVQSFVSAHAACDSGGVAYNIDLLGDRDGP